MILFFETYSIIQTLLLIKPIKKAEIIYFHKKSFPPIRYNPRKKKFVEGLIYFFNSQAKINTLPAEKVNEYTWHMNKRAIDVVETLTNDIKNSSIYKTILKIIRDENILKYYKMQLVNDISAKLLFFRIAKDLIEDYQDEIYLVPAGNDNARIQKEESGKDTLNSNILPGIFMVNRIRIFCNKFYRLIVFLLLPSFYILLNYKKIDLKRIKKKKYDIAMPIVYGFHEGEIIRRGVKRIEDDCYLYNNKITPGHIIHVFKYWRYPDKIERTYKNFMDKIGISYTDSAEYKINVNFIIIAAKIQLEIIKHFLLKLIFWHDRYEYIKYATGIILSMLKKYQEFENVDYKVELMRHDYEASHIVETILCNRHNKRTVGIQHGSTAGPYVMPQLCYVHFDKYCIFSDRHLELHAPFWNKLHLKKVGNNRIDHIVEISKNHSLVASIKNKIEANYGNKRYIALILFPSPLEYNLMEKWNAMYEALCELKSMDIDCNIFLRFRNIEHLEKSHIRRFKNLPQMDNRFIIDLVNFTTYELMAVSDMVISSSHSSGVIEAVSMNKKTFTFDYMGTAKYCFGKYGKSLILSTKNEVLKAFKDIENNFAGYDCNWGMLRKEYNYHYDGKCLERLQRVVYDTVQEIS